MGKPSTLITPAVDVTVTGVAELDLVPAALEVGGVASESDVPHFRPADGQRVIAIMIKLGPSTMTTAPAQTGWGESATLVSLDSTIMLHTDDVTIPLRGVTDGQSTAYTITCAETPCTSVTETAEVTVLASVPSSGPVRLATQTNGAAQFIDLQTGARSGKVSTVDYDRTEQAIEVNKTVTTKLTRKGYFDDADCEWAVTVERVTLGAFDGRLGWATPGKAWLAIQAELDDSSGHCYSFDTSPVSSLVALQVGKKPAKVAFASKSLFVFEVDHAVTTSSFSYTPRGRFTGSATDSDFVAKPATISFAFRK